MSGLLVIDDDRSVVPLIRSACKHVAIDVIAAVFGFTGVAGTAAWMAQVLFVVFLVLFLVSLLTGAVRRPPVV